MVGVVVCTDEPSLVVAVVLQVVVLCRVVCVR